MPYKLKGNCVVKTDTGATVKCHSTKAKAQAHLKALYANVEDAKEMKLTPKEFKDQYLKEKDTFEMASDSWDAASAVVAIQTLLDLLRSEAHQEEDDDVRQVLDLVKQLSEFLSGEVEELYSSLSKPSMAYKEVDAYFYATVEKETGRVRWVLWSSSAFEDKDEEIVSEKALSEDCDHMELTGDYGELLWWHSDGDLHKGEKQARPKLALGSCDLSLVHHKINVESGLFYDNEVGQIFIARAKEFGVSKQFWHRPDEPKDGVYTYIRTKERSLLPKHKEANFLTRLFGTKEKEMATPQERVEALVKAVGKEKADEILGQAEEISKKAEQVLASKETKEEPKAEDAALKELKELLATTAKEQADKLDALVAAQKEESEATKKELSSLKESMAELQGGYATLLGFQPKSFKASEQGKTPDLTEEQKAQVKKVKEAAIQKDGMMDAVDFILRQDAVAA